MYGDRPNSLPYQELDTRWEIEPGHEYENGIKEDMSIDACLHSVFGASKVAADVMVQEYGRYFDMKTACFRGGTLTGPAHSAPELHGFLAYVMRITGNEMVTEYHEANRVGDHIWWIGSNERFQVDYPDWKQVYDVPMICQEIYEANVDKWTPEA